ncbi:hypothetical protein NL676_016740 [Syzygium grande]|nr:hypothetical protein NL676_016740 [Syzygium grande]
MSEVVSSILGPLVEKLASSAVEEIQLNYGIIDIDLIQMWISNGLIQSSGNNQELEEIGRQYFEELCSRSFFDSPGNYLIGCEALEELPANIKNMIGLRYLFISTKQQCLPESGIGCLTSLRCLIIMDCYNLEALFDDIQSLTSLRKLVIEYCPKLASLPQGIKNMKALEGLWICHCKSLRLPEGESNEPGSMPRLQCFGFEGLPELVSIPGWLEGSASTLQRIHIEDCRNLCVLPEWLQNCSFLRTLEIKDCPRLSSLPDGVRRIATLTKLQIHGCGELSSYGELSSCGSEDDD